MGRIASICSNVGVATVVRVNPELASRSHTYLSALHQGGNEKFDRIYSNAHKSCFERLDETDS